jgi:ubiquinone/menaquinone biosynthesis C-methylase UbiE
MTAGPTGYATPEIDQKAPMSILSNFLQNSQEVDGIRAISTPRFFQHPEAAYDAQYAIDLMDLDFHRREGNALLDLCQEFGYDPSLPVLEIGCGTGRLSLSLVLSQRIGEILITDPSPAFCRITAGKLSKLTAPVENAKIAILVAEDLSKLPKKSFSLIVLRSTLHHILDVRRFFFDCAELLAPSGLFLFEEPCYEGYLLMGAMTQFMPEVLKGHGIVLNDKHLADIQSFVDTMRFYARRDLDKSACEDKHLFRPDELMALCREYGMQLEFFSNRVFAAIQHRNEPLPEQYFERFYYDYLKYAMAWDQDLVSLFERYGKKYLEYFAPLVAGGATPYTYGTFLCKKLQHQSAIDD